MTLRFERKSLTLVPSKGERDDLEIDWETDAKDRYSKKAVDKIEKQSRRGLIFHNHGQSPWPTAQ